MSIETAALSLVAACRQQGECIENYDEWSEYREDITQYFCNRIEQGATVAIYGAGYCNDIDLSKLARKASRITLIDVNRQAIETARQKYKLDSSCVSCIATDLVPIQDEVYLRFAESCLKLSLNELYVKNCNLVSMVEMAYSTCLENIKDCSGGHDIEPSDVSIVLGLHSQLNNVFSAILSVVAEETKKALSVEHYSSITRLIAEIERVQHENSAKIVDLVNRRIVANTRKSLFVGYEAAAYSGGQTYIVVDGASEVPDNIRSLSGEGLVRVEEAARVMWPFSKSRDIVYEMELLFGRIEYEFGETDKIS